MTVIRPKTARLQLDPLLCESLRQRILRRDRWRCQSWGSMSNLEFPGGSGRETCAGRLFKGGARHPMIESRLDLAMGARRNVAYLMGVAKFINCATDYLPSLFWVATVVFELNWQLLVSLIAVP
jgi:hypothetical protein